MFAPMSALVAVMLATSLTVQYAGGDSARDRNGATEQPCSGRTRSQSSAVVEEEVVPPATLGRNRGAAPTAPAERSGWLEVPGRVDFRRKVPIMM